MDVLIDLETFKMGAVLSIGVFLLALLFAIFATLDLLKFTNISKYIKTTPEVMLIISIPLFIMPTVVALGNAISEFWGDVLPALTFLFFIAGAFISRRAKKSSTHKLSH